MAVQCNAKTKRLALAASIAAIFGAGAAPVLAVDLEDIVDKLREKGVLTEEEYQEMRSEVRAEKRKMALESAQEAAEAEKRKDEARVTFKDGFTLESGDKQHSLGLTGRIHADFRSYSPSDARASAFDIRRARIGLKGKVYGTTTFEVIGEFAGTPALDVAYINYGAIRNAELRVGQFKMPYNLESLISSNSIDFQERSFSSTLFPGKERGLMVHGAPLTGFTYALAVSNGEGQNGAESNTAPIVDDKDYMGRLTVNVPEMIGIQDVVGHLGVAYTTTTMKAGNLTGGWRTEGRGSTFFSPGASGGTEFDRERTGLEAALAVGPFKLQSEWMKAEFDTLAGSRDIDTYYVYGVWAITGESYASTYRNGVFGGIKPNKPYGKDGGLGAWTVGLRYSKLDASDFASTATSTNEADAVTLGLNWHPGSMTRFMLNYVKTDFDTPITINGAPRNDEKAITLRAQLAF